jgi:CDP-glycerol glycerophosphotransferase (TagB/SpsB family)
MTYRRPLLATRDAAGLMFRITMRIAVLPAVFALVNVATRRNPRSILFASASGIDITGNFLAVSSFLRKNHPDIRLVFELKPSLASRLTFAQKLRLLRNIASAGVIVLDDYYPTIHSLALKRQTRVIQLWHAPGAFKKFGLSRKGLPGGPRTGSQVHTGYALAIASSPDVQVCVQEAFGMPQDRVLSIGIPKTDIYFDQSAMTEFNRDLRRRLGVGDDHRLILFTPTFRGNGQRSAHHEIDYTMWGRIALAVGPNVTILIRNHPFVDQDAQRDELPHVIDVSSGYEIEQLIAGADMLITDYSSAIFDCALLEKPMALYCPDTQSYEAARGFYFPLHDYAWGPIVHDEQGLIGAINQSTVNRSALLAVQKKFLSACDGGATERVVEAILAVGKIDK